jgi:hypothetical protein
VGNFQKLFEAALHRKVKTGDIRMNDVTLSRVVDVAAQTFVFSLSQGIQDLNLGNSSGLQHSSDYSSFLGGSYLEVTSSGGATIIGDENIYQLSNHGTSSQRPSKTDIPRGTCTNGSPVATVDQMYTQGIDHNVIPAPTINSGAMDQFQAFRADTMMQGATPSQYITTFDPTPSFDNGYSLDEGVSYEMDTDTFYDNGPQSFGTGNQNNPGQVLYQSHPAIQPSTATHYCIPREICRSPHDQRR